MLWTKRVHQSTIFQTFECSNESSPNSSCHFWNHKVRVYSNFASLFSVMKDNSSVFFLAQTSYTLDKNSPSKWNFWTFEWLGENSPNSSCHFWNQESVFLQTLHHSSVSWDMNHYSMSWKITPLYFSSNLMYFGQKEPVEVKFSDFWVVGWKFNKFLMSCLKLQVSFSLNFASLFSVMRDNSSVLF